MKFFASGTPVAKGNHAAVCPRSREHHRGHSTPCRPFVTEDYRGDRGKKLKAWETALRVASRAVAPPQPLEGPMAVSITFRLQRPACRAREACPSSVRSDLDKLTRAVGDALQAKTKGYLMRDDNQIVELYVRAAWADERGTGVDVEVTPLGAEQTHLFGGNHECRSNEY